MKLYTKAEEFSDFWERYNENPLKIVTEQGNYIKLLDKYIENNKYLLDVFKKRYYYELLFFTIGMDHPDYQHIGVGFYILDKNLTDYFNRFSKSNPNSKASSFISIIKKAIVKIGKDKMADILSAVLHKYFVGQEGYKGAEDFDNYNKFEKSIKEIIRCYNEGDCN